MHILQPQERYVFSSTEMRLLLKMASSGRETISDRPDLYGQPDGQEEHPDMQEARDLYDHLTENVFPELGLAFVGFFA